MIERRANPRPIDAPMRVDWVEFACIAGLVACLAGAVYVVLAIIDNFKGNLL